MPTKPLPSEDLARVAEQASSSFETLNGSRIFITGGTGFFGHWLLETLLFASELMSLELQVTVLTRNGRRFCDESPHITEDKRVTLVEGDIRNFQFPAQPHSHIIHAATEVVDRYSNRPAYELAESMIEGTRRVLHFALATGAKRLLYTSTGAVYGRHTQLLHTPETYTGAPDPLVLGTTYEQAKRISEHLCVAYSAGTELNSVIARCFALVGPRLPLDQQYAIGNFIGSALQQEDLILTGDGTPRRSWLYMSDLAVWLWTMLTSGANHRAYNVGSDEGLSIGDAARFVARVLRPDDREGSTLRVSMKQVADANTPLNSYVPSVDRAREELGLTVTVTLREALHRTAAWHGDAASARYLQQLTPERGR
jgi:nucleoside-diphosphate-sugar epimerase